MSCGDDLKTLLSRYVDGELAPEERTRVDEHVAACSPCRELLQIFQKNESLLSNALSTESFGNTVIEAVIGEIKRDGDPAEAKPIDEETPEGFQVRPMLQLAAAALLIVGLVVVLGTSRSREIASLNDNLKKMAAFQQEQAGRLAQVQDENAQVVRSLRAEDALRRAPERSMVAYITPQHLVVRANFDPKQFGSFAVYRRAEGEADDRYVRVNGERRLDSPEYIDTLVKPGQAYVYKFRAFRSAKEDDFSESLPLIMRVPRVQELAPEKSIRVQCIDVAVTHKLAKFLLSRLVEGRTVTEEFLAKPGDALGSVREVPGFGTVDFRTNLTLDRLEDGNQTLAVSYTSPRLDRDGKPIIERLIGDTVQVATEQHEGVLSIRPNLRAFFRSTGAADVDLWKGSWIQVRALE